MVKPTSISRTAAVAAVAALAALAAGCATPPDIASRTPPLAAFSSPAGALGPDATVLIPEDQWPRPIVVAVPRDLGAYRSTSERKRAFVDFMLPLILRENERIVEDRTKLLGIRPQIELGMPISEAELVWLTELEAFFKVRPGNLEILMERLDEVPPSLALAQAAEESGWGTSRFARAGNAVFGQRTWTPGSGIVPSKRADGERHEVKVFAAPEDSVRAYMRNLNTHPFYAEFRAARRDMRLGGEPLDGYRLALGLTKYSERRLAYVESIRAIIRVNKLWRFDDIRRTARAGNPE